MREIKFRAWDIRLKKMRGVMDLKWFDNGVFRVNATESDENYEPLLYMPDHEGSEFKEFKLMQYTGLKDKSGKEIYEGDVVESEAACIGGKDFKGVVKFYDGGFFIDDGNDAIPLFSEVDLRSVVGNMYENPDLLERI